MNELCPGGRLGRARALEERVHPILARRSSEVDLFGHVSASKNLIRGKRVDSLTWLGETELGDAN